MMKKLVLLMVLFFTTCCTSPATLRSPEISHQDIVGWTKGSTVALVAYREETQTSRPYCAGVWISNDEILTALHCARAARFMEMIQKLPPEVRPFAPFLIKEAELNPMGVEISYSIENELSEIGQNPTDVHIGNVVAINEGYDLALIKTVRGDIPSHYIGRVANIPSTGNSLIGTEMMIVGHPRGLVFSVSYGRVAAIRQTIPEEPNFILRGPFVQIGGYAVEPGNSGGGAWNKNGEIVGIVSFTYGARSYGFVIHADSIREFLTDAHKKSNAPISAPSSSDAASTSI